MTDISEQEKGSEQLPPFSEQLAQQLGGVRGLIESGIPVVVFVLGNVLFGYLKVPSALNWAIGCAVASALVIAAYRLWRKQTVRHAVNGLVGIAIGAYLAWKTGDAKAFYLPGIITNVVYGVVLLGSVLVGKPIIGYVWAVVANGGKQDWSARMELVRTFRWVTCFWAALFLVKGGIQYALWASEAASATALGIARLGLGYPPWVLGLAVTAWAVRRAGRPVNPATA
ncbi:DUF3159 domain-containing protein [Longispora albida]|uniref:DUF3159 domain-containing protein n=1 Tax=Longispora albida TaxID=203523 RepID=UPI000366AB2C|nr:DUF3159 domain-containing protein [Longispora albida]